MKYAREIKVGLLATICLFLLFFGFNFLKGVNIFSPTNAYHGVFYNLHGLEEQAAVYIRGHKVGQVDQLHYDFANDSAFTVDISIRKDIQLPQGTQMALISDGLLGGMAIELQLPEEWPTQTLSEGNEKDLTNEGIIKKGTFLPTTYVPGLMESLQGELVAKISNAVEEIDSLVAQLNGQLEGNHIKTTLANVDRISGDLTGVSSDLKRLMKTQVPTIVNNADTAISNLNVIVSDIKQADLKATVARVDKAVDGVNGLITDVRSQEGTIGQLIYNKSLYDHIDATVISADSLLTDLKAHPKRYVHFSVFGKKDK
ncbi:MAG: MCE family protein [Paludibacteraceae bacterium]|nr:MCE family protein [Paludibacteraceae bacterium]